MNQHYFSAEPTGVERRRKLAVQLGGKDVKVQTSGSIFSPDGVDRGTQVLLDTVPDLPATGSFLDLGSGWGPLALSMGLESPTAHITAVEVNERAANLTQDNAKQLGITNIEVLHPDLVNPELVFDVIWSNPPIRVGKKALHSILTYWLPRLKPAGEAWLVVAKSLGADSLQPWIQNMLEEVAPGQFSVTRVATEKGFRVIKILRTPSQN